MRVVLLDSQPLCRNSPVCESGISASRKRRRKMLLYTWVFEDPTRIRKILWEYHTADALLQGDEPFSNRRRRLAILAGMIGIEFVESGGVDRTWDEQLSVMDLLDGLMSDGR